MQGIIIMQSGGGTEIRKIILYLNIFVESSSMLWFFFIVEAQYDVYWNYSSELTL